MRTPLAVVRDYIARRDAKLQALIDEVLAEIDNDRKSSR